MVAKRGVVRFLLLAIAAGAGYAEPPFVVPLTGDPPVIDGRITDAEWATGCCFDGFGRDGTLVQRRVRGYVAATSDTLFLAIRSRLPDEGRLTARVDRDSAKVVFDDAVEIFIDPKPAGPEHVDYHFLANALGRSAYGVHVKGAAADRRGSPSYSVPLSISAMYQLCAMDTICTEGSSATRAK